MGSSLSIVKMASCEHSVETNTVAVHVTQDKKIPVVKFLHKWVLEKSRSMVPVAVWKTTPFFNFNSLTIGLLCEKPHLSS